MGKTPRPKNATKYSPHSRAARRTAASPPPLLSKSLTHPSEPTILGPHISSGITKRKPQQRPLKRKQRLRLEAGRIKAENVVERTKTKTIDSEGRGARKKKRRNDWEDIDGIIEREGLREIAKKEKKKMRNGGGHGRHKEESPGVKGEEWEDGMDVGDEKSNSAGEERGKAVDNGNLLINGEETRLEAAGGGEGVEENEDEIT